LNRKSLVSISITALMLLAFLAYLTPTHAYTNATPSFCNNASLASGTSIVYTLGCTTAGEVTLTIIMVICNSPSVTGITDTSTNTWILVTADSASWTGVGGTGDGELWYSQMKASTPSTDTITVALSQTLACSSEVYNADTSSYVLSQSGKVHSSQQTGPFTNLILNTATFSTIPNSVIFELGLWNLLSSTGTFSINFNNVGAIRTANSQNIKPAIVQWTTAAAFLTSRANQGYSGIFSVSNSGNAFPQVLTGVFIPNGLTQPFCGPATPNCVSICGGQALGASTTAVAANQTFLYLGQTLLGGLSMKNVTTRLSSISLTNNQQSVTVELAVYSTFGTLAGTNPNLKPISVGNPLIKFAQKDFILRNTGTAQTLQFDGSVGGILPSNVWFAIALSVSHTGVNVFQTTTTNTMQVDANEGFGPGFITQYAASTPGMYIACAAPVQVQTISTTSVVLAITTTQTVTTIQNLSNPQQATFWYLPLLFILFPVTIFLPVATKAKARGYVLTLFLMLALSIGAMIGAFANVFPLPLMILVWAGFFVMAIRASANMKPYTIMLLPIIVITLGGLLFGASPDFVNNTGNGFPNNWQGCQSSCSVANTLISIVTASVFGQLLKGDFFGFFASLFNPGAQTGLAFNFLTSIAFIGFGLLLIVLSTGISVQAFGSGFSLNDTATRMAQSLGITLLLLGPTNLLFGAWLIQVSPDWAVGAFLTLFLNGVSIFGGYLNGRTTLY